MKNQTLPELPNTSISAVSVDFDGGTSFDVAVREALALSAWLGVPVTGQHNAFQFTVNGKDKLLTVLAEWEGWRTSKVEEVMEVAPGEEDS